MKVCDDEDVETMSVNHEFYGFHCIDLYIRFEQCQQTQMSQIINAPEDSQNIIPNEYADEEDVKEEKEAQVDSYYTTLFEEGDHVEPEAVNDDEQHIPVGNVFRPSTHMTNICLSADQSSFE